MGVVVGTYTIEDALFGSRFELEQVTSLIGGVSSLVVVLVLLPNLWPVSRSAARAQVASKLRRLWCVVRLYFATTGAMAGYLLIDMYRDPSTPLLGSNQRRDLTAEKFYTWAQFLQLITFAVITDPRVRLWYTLTSHRTSILALASTRALGATARSLGLISVPWLKGKLPTAAVGRDHGRSYAASSSVERHSAPWLRDWPEIPERASTRVAILSSGAIRRDTDELGPHQHCDAPHCLREMSKDEGGAGMLGKGSYGIVLAGLLDGSTPVAAKLPQHLTHAGEHEVDELRRELRIMQKLELPRCAHVCQLHGACVLEGCPAILLELFEGGDLFDALGIDADGAPRPGLSTPLRRWRLAPQITSGLAHIHRQNVHHRDVRLANCLLRPSLDHVVLADFGLARHATDGASPSVALGSPRYLAPETLYECYTAAADVFALGLVRVASARCHLVGLRARAHAHEHVDVHLRLVGGVHVLL